MKRKEFVITEKQLQYIRKKAKDTGLSQNEINRRLLDKGIDEDKNRQIGG